MASTKVLGTVRDFNMVPDDSYDDVLLMHTNVALFSLYQLGAIMMFVTTADSLWSEIVLKNPSFLEIVKLIVSIRVKLQFGISSTQYDILKTQLDELESRVLIETDTTVVPVP